MIQKKYQQTTTTTTTSRLASLHTLFNLPERYRYPQCVAFSQNDELLICGGYNNHHCYSYHLQKQQYRWIGSYPKHIRLQGHIVIAIPSNSFYSSESFILLSFGGRDWVTYHTLIMQYKSVWNDENEIKETEKEKEKEKENKELMYNKWISLPNDFILGKERGHNLFGARALIGGSNQHLLFITYQPNRIDVIDLKSFDYLDNLQNNFIPLSQNMISLHCFVSTKVENPNEFILMSKGEVLLINYQEEQREFLYQNISTYDPLKDYWNYAFVCLNQNIFIFGGRDYREGKNTRRIWKFDIDVKNWKECDIEMPFAISGASAVVDEIGASIHIIGGEDDIIEAQCTHYMSKGLTLQEIGIIIAYWIQENKAKSGWISEFEMIIAKYIG